MGFVVVVPARLRSTRLKEKPLALIGDKPLVVWCWERAIASGADEVVVAVDHPRIAAAVEEAGGRAMLTDPDHESGTDRIAEVARRCGWAPRTPVVNLQGDEPLIDPAVVRGLAGELEERPRTDMATCATPITTLSEYRSPNVVKTVLDEDGHALYFSRAPIPFARDAEADSLPPGALRHLGLYAYRAETLSRLSAMKPSALERLERLEQLRALGAGMSIYVQVLSDAPPPGVDTPEDLERVRQELSG